MQNPLTKYCKSEIRHLLTNGQKRKNKKEIVICICSDLLEAAMKAIIKDDIAILIKLLKLDPQNIPQQTKRMVGYCF